jgi:hypothetical protein
MTWQPMRDAPHTERWGNKVDLLVKPLHYPDRLFRITDCFVQNGDWFSDASDYGFKFRGWEPVAWLPIPEIPDHYDDRSQGKAHGLVYPRSPTTGCSDEP